jgi:hypothetical protein
MPAETGSMINPNATDATSASLRANPTTTSLRRETDEQVPSSIKLQKETCDG